MTHSFAQSVKPSRLSGTVGKSVVAGKKCRGFTLIEVLVAMVMMAIALLGLSGLLSTGMGQNQRALNDSQVLLLLEDMGNRMRANSDAARAGLYDMTADTSGFTSMITEPECMKSPCSRESLAAYDKNQWMFQLYTLLEPADPEHVRVTICRVLDSDESVTEDIEAPDLVKQCVAANHDGTGTLATIVVMWGGEDESALQQSMSMNVSL